MSGNNDKNHQQSLPSQQQQQTAHTYVAGEGTTRLANAARDFGLEQRRAVRMPVREALTQLFEESLALCMHSVGALGNNERVDNTGSLHYVSVRRRTPKPPDYGTLQDLFQKEPLEIQLPEEEEEEIVEDIVEGGSLQAGIFGIIKGTVGPAILYLPHGFAKSGFAVAVPSMMFATYMFIYNAYRLLECWKVESDKQHEMATHIDQVLAYLPPSEANNSNSQQQQRTFTPTLLTYPELARRALGPYAFFVRLGIALMQFGVCLTYLIFVPQNLQECTLAWTGVQLPKIFFLVIMILIEIPLCWITDIRKLTPTNVMATLLIAFGLCSVLGLAFARGFSLTNDNHFVFEQNLSELPAWTDAWFIFIGTSFFMMEGSITLIVPLQEAVFTRQDREKFPYTNQVVTSWICVFYIFFSVVSVAGFGVNLKTAMTASLTGNLAAVVQLAYSVAVILTFPLQAFPAMQVTVTAVLGKQKRNESHFKRSVLATFLVLLLGLIAVVSINFLGNVVSILGSLFGIPLALIFPPIMHNSLIKDSTPARRRANYCVVGIGFVAMGLASAATILSWDKGAEGG